MPRFEAIGVAVGDLARSATFYRELGYAEVK
jgi:catechol 2,3-dioxygenase-like lactoylglutathione lyase family enzyme